LVNSFFRTNSNRKLFCISLRKIKIFIILFAPTSCLKWIHFVSLDRVILYFYLHGHVCNLYISPRHSHMIYVLCTWRENHDICTEAFRSLFRPLSLFYHVTVTIWHVITRIIIILFYLLEYYVVKFCDYLKWHTME